MSETVLTVSFHKSLYMPEAVQAAVDAYGPYVESASVEDGEFDVTVTLKGYDPRYGDAIGDAFKNHALFETIVRTRENEGGALL